MRGYIGKGTLKAFDRLVKETKPVDPRDPDHSRTGIFVYHNCYRCDHGKKLCVQGGSHQCDNPVARND